MTALDWIDSVLFVMIGLLFLAKSYIFWATRNGTLKLHFLLMSLAMSYWAFARAMEPVWRGFMTFQDIGLIIGIPVLVVQMNVMRYLWREYRPR